MESKHTEGEKAFIRFCDANQYYCQRLVEGQFPSPDFIIKVSPEEQLIVEVKDFETNEEELAAIRHYKKYRWATWNTSNKPGGRIRNKIESSKKQLRNNNYDCPRLLLLYDNRPDEIGFVSEYEISVAMYGLEKRIILDEKLIKIHGLYKKFTENKYSYISYIGLLEKTGKIIMYENYYAKYKLRNSSLIKLQNISIKRIMEDPRLSFCKWL